MTKDLTNLDTHYGFGRNWQRFLRCLTDTKRDLARQSLTEFMNLDSLEGLTFLDLGCGSGLFSEAAYRLGARRVVSVDLDPFSVACCRHLHEQAGSPDHWTVLEGSVLEEDFLQSLKEFDIVYSWGVLHHTGRMWDAVSLAARCVAPGGRFYIALYNRREGPGGTATWQKIKRLYNALPTPGRLLLEWLFMGAWIAGVLASGRNPLSKIRRYGDEKRGMSWQTDVSDWLGGYPYEAATVEEVFRYMQTHFPHFRLVNLKTVNTLANNWFLFVNEHPAAPEGTIAP